MTSEEQADQIAIVGMAGRFPGANNVDEFWNNLRDGVESISFFSDEELRESGVDGSLISRPDYVKAYGLLRDVDLFAAGFFSLRGQEAEIMDPQHRLFLEEAWKALEHAGYDAEQYEGAIGVFAGTGVDSYMLFNLLSNRDVLQSVGILQTSIRNRADHLSTQLAYHMNLKGPALTIQTACSTSLVAVHVACQNIINGECDMALAGGVSIGVPQKSGYIAQEGGILSADGHCRAFDAQATGTVGGSGVGIVVLKRLTDAITDRDTIHGVILGSAINNDGTEKVGYTAPGVDGQTEVIAQAQAIADVRPETISYVEAHGTGTKLGDPIEVEALTRAFRSSTNQHCALGAVKTNVGHLDTAAGVTGLIKTTLALGHQQIPPSLHFTEPNPAIDFENSPFYVNSELADWTPPSGAPRRAGVSSFGLGGTNAHVVIEEAPAVPPAAPARPFHLLMLSAKSTAALEDNTANLSQHLLEHPDECLADVAYTLQVGRRRFGHRRAIVCQDGRAADALTELDPRNVQTGVKDPKSRSVVFMFTGQGAQYARMGLDVYRAEPTFRKVVDDCCKRLVCHLGFDLRDALYPDDADLEQANRKLRQTSLTQPALFVLEYGLAQLWMSWGVRPAAMIGHSVGELVAACLSGVFSLDDALHIVALRGRLMQSCPSGSMLAVTLSPDELQTRLSDSGACIAAINGSQQCVAAGPHEVIDRLEQELVAENIGCRRLETSHAFHSPMMESVLTEFTAEVEKVPRRAPTIPFISNVTGTWITDEAATDSGYWARHIRQTVRFHDGLTELTSDPDSILLEVGPGWTLMSMARWHPKRAPGQLALTTLRNKPDNPESDYFRILSTLGSLWLSGVEVDSKAFYQHENRRRVPLPTYSFQRQKYWVEPQLDTVGAEASLTRKPGVEDWFYVPSWKRSASVATSSLDFAAHRWMVLVDETGFGQSVVETLSESGADVVAVSAGRGFEAITERSYRVDPDVATDYTELAAALRARTLMPTHIVHAWELTSTDGGRIARDIPLGLASLLNLAKSFGTSDDSDKIHIGVLSNGMQEVIGGDALFPEKATLLGACRAIPAEFGNLNCQAIDLEIGGDDREPKWSTDASLLLNEILLNKDPIVAYRGRHRWVRTYDALPLSAVDEHALPIRAHNSYLITGGLGGIGLEIAKYLARQSNVRLILTGRSDFPDRNQWDQYTASHGLEDRTAQRISALREIESVGSSVHVEQVDVADEEGMRQLFQRASNDGWPVKGVVHAAGIAGGGMIQLKSTDSLVDSLRAKVRGTQVLEKLLADAVVDFLVLCSSRASIIGGLGQVDYCAANAFLDAFAHYDSATNQRRTVTINWPGWSEVGMRVDTLTQLGIGGSGDAQPSDHQSHEAVPQGEIYHPLLERIVLEENDKLVFETELSVDKHWVLDDHRIVRKAVVPGVAYVEIGLAAAAKFANGQSIELSDVYFLAACSVRDDEVRPVHCVVQRNGDELEYHVYDGRYSTSDSASTPVEFAFGHAKVLPAKAAKLHRIEDYIARCDQRTIIATDQPLTHDDLGPRWQNVKRIYIGNNELVAELELDDEYVADLHQFLLHPALIDRTNGAAKIYLSGEGLYMPMSYRRITFNQTLPKRIFAYHRFNLEDDPTRETINFDVVLMDADGVELAVIERFSQKKVNAVATPIRKAFARATDETEERNAVGQTGLGQVTSRLDQPKPDEALATTEGLDAFARILSHTGYSQVIVSPRDLDASIALANQRQPLEISDEIVERSVSTLHPRPDLENDFVPPRTDLEQKIAEIWQACMGIEQVGAEDNFFDLGGDSVVGIQMLARFSKEGFQLTPQELFQYQTVASLAEVLAEKASGTKAAEDIEEQTRHQLLRSELTYWLDPRWDGVAKPSWLLSVDESDSKAEFESCEVSLDDEDARALLTADDKSDRVELHDLLLAAFLDALHKATGEERFSLDLSLDTRGQAADSPIDYPAIFEWNDMETPGEAVKRAKEQHRRVPDRGRGYATLQERADAASRTQLRAVTRPALLFRLCHGSTDLHPPQGNTDLKQHALVVQMDVSEQRIGGSVCFNPRSLTAEFAKHLTSVFHESLSTLAGHFATEDDAMYTPSDFEMADLDQQQLDRILSSFGSSGDEQ